MIHIDSSCTCLLGLPRTPPHIWDFLLHRSLQLLSFAHETSQPRQVDNWSSHGNQLLDALTFDDALRENG